MCIYSIEIHSWICGLTGQVYRLFFSSSLIFKYIQWDFYDFICIHTYWITRESVLNMTVATI